MEATVQKSTTSGDWKELYKAAIFEDDNAKIPERIIDAERALSARVAELFGTEGNQVREQQAMENATYFLRLLRQIERVT